jgi:hypothetical protein
VVSNEARFRQQVEKAGARARAWRDGAMADQSSAAALGFVALALAAVVKLRRDRTAQHAVDLSERGTLRLGTRKR